MIAGVSLQIAKDVTQVSEKYVLDVPGLQALRKELLKKAVENYKLVLPRRGDDPRLRTELAAAYLRLAQIGVEDGSVPEVTQAFTEAYFLLQQLIHDESINLAASDSLQVGIFRGRARRPSEQLDRLIRSHAADADQIQTQFLELWKRLVQRYSDVPGFKNDLAGLYTLGGIVQMDGYDDPEKALSLFQQSRQLQEELVEHYPGDANRTNFRKELAVAYGNLGDASRRLGQPARALDFYRRSNRIHRDLARENPKNISFAYDLAQSCLELGKIHQALGHAADALKDCAEAQKHYQELTSESGNLNYRIELAEAYDQLGGIRFAQGEFAKALDDHWQALKIRDRLVRKHGEEGAARLNDSARWLARIGEHAQAMAAVNQMSRHKNLSGVTIFEAAAICAVCSAKARARRDHEYAPADRDKLADQYAVAGLVLLKRAHAAGYFKDSDALKRMREDRDFAALRSRADFKVLLRAIEQSVGATGN